MVEQLERDQVGTLPWRPAARGWRRRIARSATTTRGTRIAAAVLAVAILAAIIVPPLVALSGSQLDQVLLAPSWHHLLGTDSLGRDMLLRSIYGMRISFVVALLSAGTAMVLGTAVGAAAGALGGWVDRIVMRLVDATAAVPHLVLGVFIVALFQPSVTAVVASIGLTHWSTVARIVRAEVLVLREQSYIDAAIAAGSGRLRVLSRHLVPGVTPRALLAGTLLLPHAVFHESALSFLRLGLPPHLPSLGVMIDQGQSGLLSGAWWSALVPGLFIIVPTLAVAGLAQRLHGRIDPKHATEVDVS